jgi:hypothetical protein
MEEYLKIVPEYLNTSIEDLYRRYRYFENKDEFQAV